MVPLDAVHELLQRRHARAREGGAEPTARVETGDLGGGEVLHLPGGPSGEDLLDIGGAPQVVVVDDDELSVPGLLDVVLHPGDAQLGRLVHGGQRVLGRVRGSAPVGDDQRHHLGVGGPGWGDGDEENGGPQECGGGGGNSARVHAYSSRERSVASQTDQL